MRIIQKPWAYAFLSPKGCHMFGSGLPSSVGGSTETIAMEQFMKIQSWVFQSMRKKRKTNTLERENRLSQRFTALQLPFTIPSNYSGFWQAVNGGSNTMCIPICAFQKKDFHHPPAPGSEERLSAYISVPRYWSISGITFALRPCSFTEGGCRNHCWVVTKHSLYMQISLGTSLEILCTLQEESSTWSGSERGMFVCFP